MAVNDGDIIRVTAKMSWGGSDLQNVYHAQYSGGTQDDATIETALLNSQNALYDHIKSHYPSSFSFDTISIFNVTQDRPMTEEPFPALTVGTGSGAMGALQLAPLVKFGTETARSQGRKYLPPIIESIQTEGGTFNSTVLSNLIVYGAAAIVDLVVGTGIIRYGNYNSTLARFAEWTTVIIDDILRTQRRRVQGVGS